MPSPESDFFYASSIQELEKKQWNDCVGYDHPFTRYEFLAALETSKSACIKSGWQPHHYVEIDKETGKVKIVSYIAVDDVGTVVNAMTLAGQIHGGIAQGAGQALMENIAYDPKNGQMLSGSFMDYCMPRADDFCAFDIINNPVPAKTNILGIKGAGEAGTTGALPAVINAVNHAVKDHGIKHLEMPLTAEKVWQAINT